MKKTILAIGLSLVTLTAMAQKREIRKANRAINSGDYTEALSELENAESQLDGAKDDVIAEVYYLKANATYHLAPNNPENVKQATAYLKQAGNYDGSSSTQEGIALLSGQIMEALVSSAIEDQNASRNKEAADKLMEVYELDKDNNQMYLFYAASNYHNSEELDKALAGYEELLEMGYTGVTTQYFAVNNETGEKELFEDASQRDIMMKTGAYSNPTEEQTEDITPQVLQYKAFVYIQKGELDKAIEVVDDALKADPNNTTLLRAKADVMYQLGDKAGYKKLMQEIVSLDPNNPELLFNIAVSSAEVGETEEALEYYDRVIEMDENNYAAYLNAAVLMLSNDGKIVEEMNTLGMSAADNKRYDELQKERVKLMESAVPYLTKALEIDDSDQEVKRTLANIYYQIDESEKGDKLMQEIEN